MLAPVTVYVVIALAAAIVIVGAALALVLVIGYFSVVWGIIFVIDAIRMPQIKEIQVL